MYRYRFPDIFGETWHIGIDCIYLHGEIKKILLVWLKEMPRAMHQYYQKKSHA